MPERPGFDHPLPPEGGRAQRGGMPSTPNEGAPTHRHYAHLLTRRAASVLGTAILIASAATAAVSPNILVVQPDQIHDYWVRTNTSLTVDVPNSGMNLEQPTCSAVTYTIGSDGVTRNIVVRKTIPAGDLETVARSAVKDLNYVPGAKNATRRPVFTYIVIPFNLPKDPAARKQITDACVLKDFPHGYR